MIIVKMVQTSLYQWELRSPTNVVMVTDISFSSRFEAESWVKKYISSFPTWGYVILAL